jgi:uncharacterized protein DUF6153
MNSRTTGGQLIRGGVRGLGRAVGLLLGVVVVLGLVWMHGLSPRGHSHVTGLLDGHHAAATPVSDPGCESMDTHEPCPGDASHHAGGLCESGNVPTPAALPDLPLAASPATETAAGVSATTVAPNAAAGSGCGPPSLTYLSISRT